MPAPAEGEGRLAIEEQVAEIERHCAELERGLVDGDWNAAGNALRASRRAMHALRNAMEACAGEDDAFDAGVRARLQRIYEIREDQLERLIAFRDGIAERLQTLSRWKAFASSMGAKRAPKRTAGFDRAT